MSTAKSVSKPEKGLRAESRKAWWKRYRESLRYSLYVMTHPFDGFWDLIHEKRGTMAAAHTFLFLFLLTRVLKLMLTSFQFISAPIQHLNIFEEAASLLLPFLILCLANWAMTTLFDGKGRFRDIYMTMCYALVPYSVGVDTVTLPSSWSRTSRLYPICSTLTALVNAPSTFPLVPKAHSITPWLSYPNRRPRVRSQAT